MWVVREDLQEKCRQIKTKCQTIYQWWTLTPPSILLIKLTATQLTYCLWQLQNLKFNIELVVTKIIIEIYICHLRMRKKKKNSSEILKTLRKWRIPRRKSESFQKHTWYDTFSYLEKIYLIYRKVSNEGGTTRIIDKQEMAINWF